MLVLTRQRDEVILVGDNIRITIVDIRGDRVRVGIDAPADLPVDRLELRRVKEREARKAAEKPT